MFEEIDYYPKPIKDSEGNEKPNPFQGVVKLKIPDYPDMLRLQKLSVLAIKPGTVNEVDNALAFDAQIKVIEELPKWVLNLDLTYKGQAVKDLLSIAKHPHGRVIVNECAHLIVHGIDPGND